MSEPHTYHSLLLALGHLSAEDRKVAIEDYEERAAVMQYDGGMSKDDAERRAAEIVVARWGTR